MSVPRSNAFATAAVIASSCCLAIGAWKPQQVGAVFFLEYTAGVESVSHIGESGNVRNKILRLVQIVLQNVNDVFLSTKWNS